MEKHKISSLLRKLHLIKLADYIKYKIDSRKYKEKNKDFIRSNENIKLPPKYLMYESFQLDYRLYYEDGLETANWIIDNIKSYISPDTSKILDWGCGPARIVRHLPSILGANAKVYGTDYNKKTINWCIKNIDNVQFNHNHLGPPLPYPDSFFDAIYGISIFTHLSEEMHYKWFEELFRILCPGGILLLTMHGNAFKIKLSEQERVDFENGRLVVKANTKEGHRTYGAYHPPAFVREVIKNNQVMEHEEGEIRDGKPMQDVWLIKKR